MSNEIDRATARPWKTLLCQSGWHVVDADNRFVAAMTDGTGQVGATDESRDALIVRAVNAHDALVEDLEYIVEAACLEPDELAKLGEDDIIEILVTKGALVDIIKHLALARGN